MGLGPGVAQVEAWEQVGESKRVGSRRKKDESEARGCWHGLNFGLMGSYISSRSKVDNSISSTVIHSAETKSPNDSSKEPPAAQIVSSTSTSNTESSPSTPKVGDDLKISSQLRKFTFNEIKSATRNFRPESLLGEGGFGCVFKGWIEENGTAPIKPGTGLTVAVKTLNHDGLQGHKEWLAEVNFLGDLVHPNLVKLIGYCIEDDQRLLVYEFMPRGSLENNLFRSSGSYMSILDSTLETLERITQLHKTRKETAQLKSRRHTNLFSDHILMKVESDAASTTSGSDAEFNVCSHCSSIGRHLQHNMITRQYLVKDNAVRPVLADLRTPQVINCRRLLARTSIRDCRVQCRPQGPCKHRRLHGLWELPHLVLGLISQIIKIQLLADLNLKKTPELVELIDDSKDVEELMNLPPDKVLLKWMNFHLQKAGYKRKITNFSSDVKDGEAYAVLLNVLAPEYCSLTTLDTKDPMERANIILSQAEKMSCKRYLSPKDIVEGSPNLNLAFVAHLFHERNGLSVDSNKISFAEMMHDDVHVSREERAFRLWINSLGIDTYVNSGFEDVRNGWVLLEVLAKVVPGIVNWKQANRPPIKMPFKKVENCNQVIKIGKQLKFSLVNLAGNDIVQGNKKLILAFLWQLMRYSMLQLLKNLRLQSNGKEISDSDILNWANKKVTSTGRTSRMESFKDKTLANGIFFLELLSAVEPRVVNWYIVTKGEDDDEKRLNATYIISVARKLGCSIFLLPEDIVEVNPKMILTLTASIMLWSLTKQANEDTSTIVSDSENGSITGSISNIVIDDSASETSLPPDNESESASE